MKTEALGQAVRKRLKLSGLGHGWLGVKAVGHRDYVGGLWDEIGRLQFDFLVRQGLQPSDTLVDVACGSLRAGVHFIPYLDRGHYLGIEKEAALVKAGLTEELPAAVRMEKKPEIIVSDSFEFSRFSRTPTFGIANSLFTHLPEPLIRECLHKLRAHAAPGCRFYATFFNGDPSRNDSRPHDHWSFAFTEAQMLAFGEEAGWESRYIGDWGHPRGQVVTEYTASYDLRG